MATRESLAPTELPTRTRDLIGDLSHGRFAGAVQRFDSTMRAHLPADQLASVWASVEAQLGPFVAIERVRMQYRAPFAFAFARCRFERGEKVVKVTYDGEGHVAGLFFLEAPIEQAWSPPPYADPSAFEEVPVGVGAGPELPGFLSLPKTRGPVPAVVLVHGSGPLDADETVGGTKVFKDLAFGLASRGIAVIRYAKRTYVDPRGVTTVEDEVSAGARAAIDVLTRTAGIDAGRIILLGHSQGGYLAPRIAREDGRVRGLVILAGSTRPLQDVVVEQVRYLAALGPGAAVAPGALEQALRLKAAVEDPALKADQVLPAPLGGLTGAYFLDLRGYRPVDVAASLGCPMFIARGGRDYQVGEADFEGWKRALCDGTHPTLGLPGAQRARAECKEYSDLNHLFVSGSGPSTPVEYGRPGHVDVHVIEDVARWIRDLPAAPPA